MTGGYRAVTALRTDADELVRRIVDRQYLRQPALTARYGEVGRRRCAEDCHYHLGYLSEALATGSPAMFTDYLLWSTDLLARYGIAREHVLVQLQCIQDVLRERLPAELAARAAHYIEQGVAAFALPAPEPATHLAADAPHATLAHDYLQALLATDRHRARRMIVDAFAGGVSVQDLYLHVFQPTQFEVGRLWHLGATSVGQEHFATAVTQSIMGHLYQSMFDAPRRHRSAVVCCVGNELHELGARMVADFLELAGWDTAYLGANTPPAAIARMTEDMRADAVFLSATLGLHLHLVVDSIAAIRGAVARRVPILVGGHPFRSNPDLWNVIGADGCAGDAQACVELAERLVGA